MKEGQGIIPGGESDKVLIVGQNEKHFQSIKHQTKKEKGHTLWEINMETGDIKPAEYEDGTLQINDMGQQANMHVQVAIMGTAISNQEVKLKVIEKPNHIYLSALNIQNAAKKFATKSSQKWWNELDEAERKHLCNIFYPVRTIYTIQNKEVERLWGLELKAIADENKKNQ